MAFNKKNKKAVQAEAAQETTIVDAVENKKIVEKNGKKIATTKIEVTAIEKKETDPLAVGERTIKDLIATGIDRTPEDCLKIGNKYVRSLIINGYPSVVQVGWLDDLFNYDGDADTTLHIVPSDERGAIDQLTRKITQYEAQLEIESKKGNIRNITLYRDKIQSLVEQRRSLEQNYENLYYLQIIINIYCDTKEELNKQSQKIINKLKGRRINLEPMYLMQEDSYKSALPIGKSFIKDRFRNFNSGALSACFPFYNSEISHKNGTFMGINIATGTPVFIDMYDRSVLNNSNMSVFGQAGSGKTFFVSALTLRSTLKGIKTVIIDPEGEYHKIAKAIGGANLRLAPDAKTGINPFDIEEEEEIGEDGKPTGNRIVDIKSKVADLLNLIAVMVGGLTSEEKANVAHVLAETYKSFGITENSVSLYEVGSFFDEETGELVQQQRKLMPTLTDFRNKLIAFDKVTTSVQLSKIANTLSMFCRGGIYDMFDRQTSKELVGFLDAPVINFDVSQLEENILRPIGMYIAMSWTWEKVVKKNPHIKKRIVCDEAWMLVNKNMEGHEFTAQFLENCARRIRKRNGGLLIASQNFVEFADNPQGKAVLTNTILNIFLKQNSTDIDAVQDTFKLSNGEKQFLLTANRGEMLLKMNEESSIVYALSFQHEFDLISTNKVIKRD